MHIILFDNGTRFRLLPFTHTRPIADIRCGIYTMRQRWQHLLQQPSGTLSESYLQDVFPLNAGLDNLFINSSVFATPALAEKLLQLEKGHKLMSGDIVIGFRSNNHIPQFDSLDKFIKPLPEIYYDEPVRHLNNVWDIFSFNVAALTLDFALITKGRKSEPIPDGVRVRGAENLFIEEGAEIYDGCIINASAGPVYIEKGAQVMEGVMMHGPIAIGNDTVIKMGAKIYGGTTFGPGCKVGGEINNAVFFANSNKSHDGYLGNAVIGEWCNLGADTNCSNLKNNYDEVQIWDEHHNKSVKTGLTFCGLFMADHSKCAINSMFNTGTVAGVSCNIFGHGFPNKFIPSFCWGGSDNMTTYSFDKAMDTARRMMARRNIELTDADVAMYRHIFEHTSPQRNLFIQA